YSQIKRIGASLDFSRQKFTMDSSINKAVIHSFIILYNKNLIYRDNRLVNWCGALHTSISDLEVDNREVTPNTVIKVDKGEYLFGIMYYIDYPITECSVIGSEEDSGVIGSEEGSGVIDISKGSGVIGSEEDSGVIDISKDIVSDKDSYKSNIDINKSNKDISKSNIDISKDNYKRVSNSTDIQHPFSNLSINTPSNPSNNNTNNNTNTNTNNNTTYITIATTRPETILGDTALCANPSLTHLKGKKAINPLTGKIIPIIFDEQATLDIGTGVLKITPAHDFNDFELSRKYNLDIIRVLNEDNNIEITDIIKEIESSNDSVDRGVGKMGGDSSESNIIEGVNTSTNVQQGDSSESNIIEGVNTSTNIQQGDNTSTNKQQGVNTSTIKQQGVNTSTNVQQGVNTSTNVQQGVNTSTNIQQGVNATTTPNTNTTPNITPNIHFLKSINGLKRFIARTKILTHLKNINLLKKEEPHTYTLPFCSRSNDIIEPILKKQWWLKCNNMAQKAIKAVTTNQIEIIPDECKNRWFKWLENIRDWCLSRQLVWGHRVPAYRVYVDNVRQGWVVGKDKDEAMKNYMSRYNRGDSSGGDSSGGDSSGGGSS
ncbi:valine--tRNA ligase, partial [Hamiltosporidium magnivora]